MGLLKQPFLGASVVFVIASLKKRLFCLSQFREALAVKGVLLTKRPRRSISTRQSKYRSFNGWNNINSQGYVAIGQQWNFSGRTLEAEVAWMASDNAWI